MKTLKEFAVACQNLDNNGIYELFEDEISQELRDEIYSIADNEAGSEPARDSLIKLGYMFHVKSLINY